MALAVAQRELRDYSHRCSPKKFTQPQHVAILVLKTFLGIGYRDMEAYLRDWSDLREELGLTYVPHYTAMQKASVRLLKFITARKLLRRTVGLFVPEGEKRLRVEKAAIDGSGFSSHHISRYFVKRRERGGKTSDIWQTTTYRRFPKAGIVVDCTRHLILSIVPTRGPSPDIVHFEGAVVEAWSYCDMELLIADAGYDAESSHELLRHDLDVDSLIPPKIGRPTNKLPSGRYRREMAEDFDTDTYGQRWQSETVFSMIKRNLGDDVRAESYWSEGRSLFLMAITHNVMIARPKVFYGALPTPFAPLAARGKSRWISA